MKYDTTLPDPRALTGNYPELLQPVIYPVLDMVHHYLSAATQEEKDHYAQRISESWSHALEQDSLPSPDVWLQAASSVESARVLGRLLHMWEIMPPAEGSLGIRFFALPLIIVTAAERPLTVRTVLGAREKVEALLREHRVLGDAEQWGISNALCSYEVISGPAWSEWMHRQAEGLEEGIRSLHAVTPNDMAITVTNQEQVFLRFLVGAVVVTSKTVWQKGEDMASWGMAMTECLSQQLSMPGTTVLVLPRAPKSLSLAVQEGRRLQREVSVQLFVSNAVRECRTKYGEPSIVLSSHALENGQGEIRMSISSEFSVKDAQGFCYPLFPDERIVDVQRMLASLLEDCQVQNIRVLQKVYADKEPETGLTWLFKPESIPEDELFQ